MKIILLYTISIISLFSSLNSNKCSESIPFGSNKTESLLFLRTCENKNSTSEYFEIKNKNDRDVKLTYITILKNRDLIKANIMTPLDDKTAQIICMKSLDAEGGGIASCKFEKHCF